MEPLTESAEISWIEFLNRFDNEIYPTLFKDRGYTKGEALECWNNNLLRTDIEKLLELLEDKFAP